MTATQQPYHLRSATRTPAFRYANIAVLLVALTAWSQPMPVVTNRTDGTNGTYAVGFEWRLSASPGVVKQLVRFGAASNALDRVVEVGPAVTNAVVRVASYPVWATVSAVDADGMESVPSNLAADLGWQTVVTNIGQASADLVNWRDIGVINVDTNTSFTRIRQERTERRLVYP